MVDFRRCRDRELMNARSPSQAQESAPDEEASSRCWPSWRMASYKAHSIGAADVHELNADTAINLPVETPRPDMDLIEARLKKAAELMKVSKS